MEQSPQSDDEGQGARRGAAARASEPGRERAGEPAAGAAAVDKSLGLLELVALARRPLRAAELATASGLPRSTLHRLLAVLQGRGLVRRHEPDGTWRPGYRLLEYAHAAWSGFELKAAAELELARLADATGETIELAVLDGDTTVVVAGAIGSQSIRHVHALGRRSPWSDSAAGLVLAGFADAATRERLLAQLPRAAHGPAEAAVELARGRGYALGGEGDDEVATVAAPIHDMRGNAAAALALAGPRFRLDARRLHALAPMLMAAARRISQDAGGTAMSLACPPSPGPADPAIRVAVAADALLGEAPYWSARDHALLWVDMLQPALHRFAVARSGRGAPAPQVRPLDRLASAAVPCKGGGVLLVGSGGIFRCTAEGVVESRLAHPGAANPGHRYNDAKCDPRGRLWVGTMDPIGRVELGTLWRIDAVGRSRAMDTGFAVPNGIAFSQDGRTLWFADSAARRVYAYAFDAGRGEIGPRRTFAEWHEGTKPDGLAADAEGGVWVALYDGWAVERYDSAGRRTAVVRLPVPRPTSLAFGGTGLRTLFITSARARLDPEALAVAPLSGALFAFEPGCSGTPVASFAG